MESKSSNIHQEKKRMDFTKKDRRSVQIAEDNTHRTRTKKRTDSQNDTSGEAYSNYTRLLQLFPYLHPVAIDRIFANCNRDFIRTIDNLLYIKRYFYFAQTNDCYPHTVTTTDPNYVFVHNVNVTENKQNHTNTDCSRTTDMQQANSNNNDDVDVDDGDGYIPNGNIEGIREQIRMYEEQCSLAASVLNCSLDTRVQCNSSVDANFHTSTPQVRLHSASASDDVQEETCYLQFGLGLTNYNLM